MKCPVRYITVFHGMWWEFTANQTTALKCFNIKTALNKAVTSHDT